MIIIESVIWTNSAKLDLKLIYEFYKYVKKTPQGAKNVKDDILTAAKSITFTEQYQKDNINPNYRRVVIRHFKLLYKTQDDVVIIMRVFRTQQDPNKLKSYFEQ